MSSNKGLAQTAPDVSERGTTASPPERACDLESLLARVKAATRPDRELDWAIQAWVCQHIDHWPTRDIPPDADGENTCTIFVPPLLSEHFTYPLKGKVHPWYHVPRDPVTGSMDDAMRLLHHAAPKDCGPVSITIAGSAQVTIESRWPCAPALAQEFGHTPALAILAALLTALSGGGDGVPATTASAVCTKKVSQ